jgi:WD40 repeat protein
MADVFISYSRHDQEFVRELVARLTERGRECWVDWDDIPPTAAFLQEIYEGIEASNAFLFVISPDSARSEVCRDEIEHAAENHKRIVPLLRRDPDGTPLHEAVASLNWIQVPESADLDGAVDHLVDVLAQDLDHVRRHTRTLQKALEWSRAEEDGSLLLRGSELRAAEDWIQAGAEKEPAPTQLHYRYLQASRAAATKRQRQTVAAFAVGIVIALTLAVIALIQRGRAVEASHVAESRLLASEAQSQLGHHLGTGALLALAAYRVKHTPEARYSLSVAVRKSQQLRALLGTGPSWATAVAFARTGSFLAAGLRDGAVLVYGGPHQRVLARLHAGPGAVTTVSFSRDGSRLVAVTREGWIALWRVEAGRTRFERLPFQHRATVVAFGRDGSLVLGTDRGLEWRRPDGTVVRELKTRDPVTRLAVAPDGTIAYGGSYGAYFVKPGGNTAHVPGAADGAVEGLAFDPGARRLALVVYQTGLLWTVGGSRSERIGVAGETSTLAFGPAGYLLIGGSDGHVAIRKDPASKALTLRLGDNQIQSIAARAGLLAAAGQDGLALWSTSGSELRRTVPAHGQDILRDLVFLGPGKVAVAAEESGQSQVGIKDLGSGAWQALEQPPQGGSLNLAASANGHVVAAGGLISQTITAWSGKGYEQRRPLDPRNWKLDDEPVDLAMGNDGRTLVEATDHKHLDVWALDATQRPSVIRVSGTRSRVAFAPSGTEVAVGGSDGKIARFGLGSGHAEPVGSLGVPVSALAYSLDGKRIAAGGTDGTTATTAVWRLGSSHPLTLPGAGSVAAIDFDPQGKTLAAGDDAGGLTLWDARAGFSLSPPFALRQEIVAVHFAPSGRTLLAGLGGGAIVQLGRAFWDSKAAINYLCARLNGRLPARERALYHIPGSAPSNVCG